LEALVGAGHTVALVVTQPDRPSGRSLTPKAPPVKDWAVEHGLPVEQPERVRRPEFLETIVTARPEAIVVVAYGRILTREVLDVPRRGAINVHFSILPRYRGAAPVQWSLAAGDRVTGVTTMLMNERLDEGDILLQREVPVLPDEHAPALTERLAGIGASLLVETLGEMEDGRLSPRPQDPLLATYAPRLLATDGVADFSLEAGALEGRVRAFDPWPGVWALARGRRVRIVAARAIDTVSDMPPGSVLEFREDAVRIACGGGTVLAVFRLQAEGRGVLTAREAVNGRYLAPGERLTSARIAS
jgi:methionyl-tRNA formyltransferase